MHIRTIYQALLKKRGNTYRLIAKVIGVTHGAINLLIKLGNPKTDTLLKYLAPLGYTVAIVPVGSRPPDDAYIVTSSSKPKPALAPYDLHEPDPLIG